MQTGHRPDATPAEEREEKDPSERERPLPWFMVMLIGAMAATGLVYIASTRNDLDSAFGDSRTPAALMAPVATSDSSASVGPDGAAIYAARCAACHQAAGGGIPGVFPPLAGSEWVLGDDRVLVQIPLHGIDGNLEVKGQVYHGAMPVFGTLSDQEIAAALTYVRSQWGNAAAAVDPATVRAGRERSAARTTPWTSADELRQSAAP